MMSENSLSANDFENLIQAIDVTLNSIDSLESFEIWLREQPSVVSVKTANYVLKTEPPRKEISVTFQMRDGSTPTHVIVVILYPDQTFGLANIRKQ